MAKALALASAAFDFNEAFQASPGWFALLDYAAPATHRYQYLLEGFEEAWHDANGPIGHATYVNLAERAGHFRFIVRGFRGQGDWSETSVLLTITPPWWRTA